MNEKKRIIDGIEIVYKQKARKFDAKHLVVVMSGFGAAGEFTYDFENALKDCPAHVLWIKDHFGEHCAYYMCRDLDFAIEKAVYRFILDMLAEFGLTTEECTIAGFSKGGSAALYFGLRHGFRNMIATVPQMRIGSYVKNHWPKVAKHMMGDVSQDAVNRLDRLLPNVLETDVRLERNIYLLTSPADPQYETEIKPYLGEFVKYSNFNLFVSHSRLVRAHNQVTAHNVPLILALIYSLSAGIAPRYGYAEPVTDLADPSGAPSAQPVAVLHKARVENGLLFPEGVAILRGIGCAEYADISSVLLLEGSDETYEIALAKTHRPALTRQLYEDGFVNYDKGWFCSYQHKGLDVGHVPKGRYKLSVRITCKGLIRTTELRAVGEMSAHGGAGDSSLRLYTDAGRACFTKTPMPPAGL